MKWLSWRGTRVFASGLALVLVWMASIVHGQLRTRDEMVPMRDGVKLAVSIYFPSTGTGPWPVVLSRTPYGKDNGRLADVPRVPKGTVRSRNW